MKSNEQMRKFILVTPIEEDDDQAISQVAKEIERVYGIHCEIGPLIKDISFAFDSRRNQFNSTLILKRLESIAPQNAVKIMALTTSDLFIPILTYVYGEAQLGGRCAIVSSHRLRETHGSAADPHEAFTCRLVKECIHELGHTFTLKHCRNPSCIMHYGRDMTDVDAKSRHLCFYCNILLKDELARLQKDPGQTEGDER